MSVRKGGQLIAGSVDPDKYANIALTNSPYTTNRILEIPQDIKLELNNGTLTLKAGSKVYVPNGSGVFDTVTIANDTPFGVVGTANILTFVKSDGTTGNAVADNCVSGPSQPSLTYWGFWYDTANNIIKNYNGSSWDDGGWSLPLCLATATSDSVTSIDQVFNGFGYIGSTVFVLPGVKYEYSIDVNPDGSYVNQIWTNPSVKLYTTSNTASTYSNLTLRIDPTTNVAENPFVDAYGYHYTAYTPYKYPSAGTAYWFNPATGKTVTISSSGVVGTTAYGVLSFGIYRNAGKIDWIEDISINSVNTYSRSELSGLGMPSNRYIDLTLGANGSTYTAPANGYFSILGAYNTTPSQTNVTFLAMSCGGMNNRTTTIVTASVGISIPTKKGQSMYLEYENFKLTGYSYAYFRFVYAEGEE